MFKFLFNSYEVREPADVIAYPKEVKTVWRYGEQSKVEIITNGDKMGGGEKRKSIKSLPEKTESAY